MTPELRNCPICHVSHSTISDFSREGWTLKTCDATGMLYLENAPAYEALESQYAFEITFEQERKRRNLAEPRWSRLSTGVKVLRRLLFPNRNKFLDLARATWIRAGKPSPFKILDVGCGLGGIAEKIHSGLLVKGADVVPYGIEVSLESSRISSAIFQRLGGTVVNKPAIEGIAALKGHSFHCVILSSYLEHETRPFDVLSGVRDCLSDRGQALIKLPNFSCWNRVLRGKRWCGFRFPDHVNYFTPRSLRQIVSMAGLKVNRMNPIDRLPFSDNMYLTAGTRS
jgi:2-polyprenyl-3-methyl-5-hydroxy-6-metoxy-1,4-benzoquinol methylase